MSPIELLNPMQRYLVHEFVEDYDDGLLSRRDMMSRVLHITGGVASTATLLTTLGVRAAGAQGSTPAAPDGPRSPLSVAEDDPRVLAANLTYPGADEATVRAYQFSPTEPADSPPALVLVCHENRGLTEHIKDVARRFAAEGYVACAVDLLSRQGGTDAVADPSQIPSILSEGDPARHVADFQAAIAHYGASGEVDMSRIGMTGYCFGGGITWRAATQIAELKAAVPYYGPPPPLADVPNIRAAVLGVYSDDPNDFANQGRAELVAALEEARVTFEMKVYPGTQHAFNNDTGLRYNEEQAIAAWNDTLAWFARYLVAGKGSSGATPAG
jgi:carboxymethylenebutenolidase